MVGIPPFPAPRLEPNFSHDLEGSAMAYLPELMPTFSEYKISCIVISVAFAATLVFNLFDWL
jgi:hypothetical protein